MSVPTSLAQALELSSDQMAKTFAAKDRGGLQIALKTNAEMWEIIGEDVSGSDDTELKDDLLRLRDFVRAVTVNFLASAPADEPAGIEAVIAINRNVAGGIRRRAAGTGERKGDSLVRYAEVLDLIAELDLEQAVKRATEIAEEKGEDGALHYVIGAIQFLCGNVEDAKKSMMVALDADQYCAEARNALARMYELAQDSASATLHMSTLRNQIATVPDWLEASELTQLAAHMMSQNRLDDAFVLASRSAQLAPWMTDNWWIMSYIAAGRKEAKTAMTLAASAVARNVADARLRHHLISCLYRANASSLAIAHHRMATPLFCNHSDPEMRRFFSR